MCCSRNNLLSAEDRARAPCIHTALQWAERAAAAGEATSAAQLCGGVRQRIADGGGRVDYVEVRFLSLQAGHGMMLLLLRSITLTCHQAGKQQLRPMLAGIERNANMDLWLSGRRWTPRSCSRSTVWQGSGCSWRWQHSSAASGSLTMLCWTLHDTRQKQLLQWAGMCCSPDALRHGNAGSGPD